MVPSNGLTVGWPGLAVGTRMLLQACVGAGDGKCWGRRLNRQMDICTPPKLVHVECLVVAGRKTHSERNSIGCESSPAPAANPWVETRAGWSVMDMGGRWGWRTGLLSQWFGLGLFLKCSCNRNESKSPASWIISQETAWEGEREESGPGIAD